MRLLHSAFPCFVLFLLHFPVNIMDRVLCHSYLLSLLVLSPLSQNIPECMEKWRCASCEPIGELRIGLSVCPLHASMCLRDMHITK